MYLSKSDYQIGRRCLKRLWQEKHGHWQAELSATNEKNAFEGNRFNDAVHAHFKDGVMICWGNGTAEEAVKKTSDALQMESIILYEAFFLHNGLLCLADVIIKEGNKISLIEAKSSNNPKIKKSDDFEHIQDASFQAYVMSQSGFKPNEVLLLHANGECIWPDKENLFSFVDITEDVAARFDEVEMISNRLLRELNIQEPPTQPIGRICKKPADKACPHIESCWSLPTTKTVYDLPRLSGKIIEKLEHENVHLIEDIPHDFELSKPLRKTVDLLQTKSEVIDTEKLSELITQLKYPLHFFDFETYNPAVPMWDKSRPWQQVPFQYSLHILHENGELEHFDYIHTNLGDPRPELISAMKAHFLESGSVIVYYEPFEKSRLKEMADDFPENAAFLDSIHDRVWDQLNVFKICFEDHRLALSKSIKVVLPTFVADLSYKTLNVQKGDQAQLEWRKMIDIEWQPTKEKMAGDLKTYCELDTFAMVRLHEFLQDNLV